MGFLTNHRFFTVGSMDFLHCFFSNICFHLEKGCWGSKYPSLMNELYNGTLPSDKIDLAISELNEIKRRLSFIRPSDVIWDIENLDRRPPWGNEISEDITNLANYFITSEGEDLFDVLNGALLMAKSKGDCLQVINL